MEEFFFCMFIEMAHLKWNFRDSARKGTKIALCCNDVLSDEGDPWSYESSTFSPSAVHQRCTVVCKAQTSIRAFQWATGHILTEQGREGKVRQNWAEWAGGHILVGISDWVGPRHARLGGPANPRHQPTRLLYLPHASINWLELHRLRKTTIFICTWS